MLIVSDKDLKKFLNKKFKTIHITTTYSIVQKLLSMNFQVEIIPNFKTVLHKNILFHIHSNLFYKENI